MGDGRGIQDWELIYTHSGFMSMYGKNQYSIVEQNKLKIKFEKKKKKTKIMASGPINSWEMGKQWKEYQTLFSGAPKPQFKSIHTLALSFLYSPVLTSIHDHWKNHSPD